MELRAVQGVHFDTSSPASTLENPELESMGQSTDYRISINEASKFISTKNLQDIFAIAVSVNK